MYNSTSWVRMVNNFKKELKSRFRIEDELYGVCKFPSQEIAHNILLSIKLFKWDSRIDQKFKDYANYFYVKLLYKSREELSKSLWKEDIERKDREVIKAK